MIDGIRSRLSRRPTLVTALLLAVLAYVPAITAAPGRMPSDSKLYLYLDPGRFLADAAATFDPRQFAGWVPHQHIAYLWPAGPWFWVFEQLGVPDWVAHRLWIGTIMVIAGLGVRWCARLLGLAPIAAATAAIVYQLSPYVLPYVSRTSVMLLPWAGLGWIVAFTIRALRRQTWSDPAAIALIVFTVGAVNATALAMIVPAPVLWLIHAAWLRTATWRDTAIVACRIGVLSLAVSVWWIVMLSIQGRHGVDVLPFSESLADVSLTASSTEVLRGLGYWLFYVRDTAGATTTESLRYLISTPAIVISYAVPLVCLVGLVVTSWAHRRYAALLVTTGAVLAVGVHPIDDRSPLMRILTGDGDGGFALALRSSTRALPVMTLGLALSAAAMVTALDGATRAARRQRPEWSRQVVAAGVALLAIVNVPALWTGGFVDPALERDEDPPDAWLEAAAALDRRGDAARVLQVPGAEFGAFRWGYTVDQPLPGLTDKPVVTRDLLPLGSAAAMDVVYALDDRLQDGTFEVAALAPVARLLGADTVWLANDLAFDRFRTARPELVTSAVVAAARNGEAGLGDIADFGDPVANVAEISTLDEVALADPRVGAALPPVQLVDVTGAVPTIRAADVEVVVSGSADGLVDAAAAGLIDGSELIRYSASLDEQALADALDGAERVIVTDSNRDRARHWRSSQDTTGFTESGGPEQDVLRPVASDQRLPVFATTESSTQTVAIQDGPIRASASAYGEPFAYLPEHRPFMSIDGDPRTSWLVGEHGDPIGETLRLDLDRPPTQVTLRQPPAAADQRRIGSVTLAAFDGEGRAVGEPVEVELDDRSLTANGQDIDVPNLDQVARLEVTILSIDTPIKGVAGSVAGVGFAEVDTGLGGTLELIRPPTDALALVAIDQPLDLVFTRLRVDPADRWRDDPEPILARRFELTNRRTFAPEITARLDLRAPDERLAALFGWPVIASTRLAGFVEHAGAAAFDGDVESSWITGFDDALGATLSVTEVGDGPIESVVLSQPGGEFSAITEITLVAGDQRRVLPVTVGAGEVTLPVVPPVDADEVQFVITGVDRRDTIDRRFGDRVALPAAIAELTFAGRPTIEPIRSFDIELDCEPLLDADGRPVLADVSSAGLEWFVGEALEVTPCTDTLELETGRHVVVAAPSPVPIVVDRVLLSSPPEPAPSLESTAATANATLVDADRLSRTVEVSNCDRGCWVVLGEGFNEAWEATGPAGTLGEPELVDGGYNGWYIEPAGAPVTIEVRWTAQRPLTIAYLATLAAVAAAVALVVRDLRRRLREVLEPADVETAAQPAIDGPELLTRREPLATIASSVGVAVVWVIGSVALVGPVWGLAGALGGGLVALTRRPRLAALVGWLCLTVVAVAVVVVERLDAPFPNGGWPTVFDSWHHLGLFGFVSLLVGTLTGSDRADRPIGNEREHLVEEPVEHP